MTSCWIYINHAKFQLDQFRGQTECLPKMFISPHLGPKPKFRQPLPSALETQTVTKPEICTRSVEISVIDFKLQHHVQSGLVCICVPTFDSVNPTENYKITRNTFCGTWYLAHSHIHNERTVPIIMAGCTAHARNGRISTSGLKSDVTIAFLDPDFL